MFVRIYYSSDIPRGKYYEEIEVPDGAGDGHIQSMVEEWARDGKAPSWWKH